MSAFWHPSVPIVFRDSHVYLVLDFSYMQGITGFFPRKATPLLHLLVNLARLDQPFGRAVYQTWVVGVRVQDDETRDPLYPMLHSLLHYGFLSAKTDPEAPSKGRSPTIRERWSCTMWPYRRFSVLIIFLVCGMTRVDGVWTMGETYRYPVGISGVFSARPVL